MIYLDYNAGAPLRPEASEAMQPWLDAGLVGNPASVHAAGRRARRAIEDARDHLASLLGAGADEVIFTSGATEANNLAVFGLAGSPPGRIITSPVEHPCVIEPLRQLVAGGFAIDQLPVNPEGLVPADSLQSLLRDDTRLVAVMLANHETGALQPIAQLQSTLPADRKIAFHCDAAQAAGKIAIDFHALGVTSLSVSGHKFGAPPGIGLLLLNRCAQLRPILFGGHQQRGRRPGTEPVALIVGLSAALAACVQELSAASERMLALRRRFLDALSRSGIPMALNGPVVGGLNHVINVSFPGCRADGLLMALDQAGVCCSTGSACSSGSLLPSPVLRAMNVPEDRLRSALRFSFGSELTAVDIDEATARICRIVKRSLSDPDCSE